VLVTFCWLLFREYLIISPLEPSLVTEENFPSLIGTAFIGENFSKEIQDERDDLMITVFEPLSDIVCVVHAVEG